MSETVITYRPIGVVRSDHLLEEQTPVKPAYASGCKGRVERGIFATRSPCRPSPVGPGIVTLVRREGNVPHLDNVDILDGPPFCISSLTRRNSTASIPPATDGRTRWTRKRPGEEEGAGIRDGAVGVPRGDPPDGGDS